MYVKFIFIHFQVNLQYISSHATNIKVGNVINVSSVARPPKRNPLPVQNLTIAFGIWYTYIVANKLEVFFAVFVLKFEQQG